MNSINTNEATDRGTAAHNPPPPHITISVERQIRPSTPIDLGLPLLQIGFDRVCVSCPRHSLLLSPVQPPEHIPFQAAGGHLTITYVRDRRPMTHSHDPWTGTATYAQQPAGPYVRLLYRRSRRFAPHMFAILRPAPSHVFSLRTLLLLLNALGRALKLPLMLSSLEIAADFTALPIDARRLASRLWVPRILGHRCFGNESSPTTYRGRRSSAFQVKTYWKHEGTLQAVRLEFTFRRRALRTLPVAAPDSLARIDWRAACSRRARLVTLPMNPRRRTALSIAAREAFGSDGIFAVRDCLGTPGMRWLSRNVVSSPMQHTLETALAALGHLPAGAPQDIAQPRLVESETVSALLGR